jgi:hypothetical protein
VFLFTAAACFAKKRYYGLAGAYLAWASLLRVFPVIAFFGWGVMIALHWFKHRTLLPSHKRLIAGAALTGAVLIPASMVVTYPGAYVEFAHHIQVHKDTPLTNHMGLETMLSHSWDGRMWFAQDDRLDDPFEGWKQGRVDRKHTMRPLQIALILFVMGWIVWALRRTKHLWIAMPLSVPLIPTILNLTCYYYAIFVVTAVLAKVRPALAPVLLVSAAASQMLHYRFDFIDDKFTAHSWLFYALGLMLLFGYSRPFSIARLRAWLAGKPEPKADQSSDSKSSDSKSSDGPAVEA